MHIPLHIDPDIVFRPSPVSGVFVWVMHQRFTFFLSIVSLFVKEKNTNEATLAYVLLFLKFAKHVKLCINMNNDMKNMCVTIFSKQNLYKYIYIYVKYV